MKYAFYTPCHGVEPDVFGAATYGVVGAENEKEDCLRVFREELQGELYAGSYEEILRQIPEGDWQAGVVLFGNAGGENAFLRQLSQKVSCPMTGGGAAIDPVSGQAGLITGQKEAAVFLIRDDRYEVGVCSENIHHTILGECELTLNGAREVAAINGVPAAQWLCQEKAKLGLDNADFEHLTLSDKNGVNAHLSQNGERIFSGRDLETTMLARYVEPENVQERMERFYDDETAVVFGCAGLKGILPQKMQAAGLGLFMFGEVCTMGGVSEFGNLMLSKLQVKKRG